MARAALLLIGGDTGLLQLTAPGAGERWLRTPVRLLEQPVTTIWLDRHDPLVCAAGGPAGGQVSTDGGSNWRPFTGEAVRQVIGWPSPTRRIVAQLASGDCLAVDAATGATTPLGTAGGLLVADADGPLAIDAAAVRHVGRTDRVAAPAPLPDAPRAVAGTPHGHWVLTDRTVWRWGDGGWLRYAACPAAHLLAVPDAAPALVVVAGDAIWRIAGDGPPARVAIAPGGGQFRALQAVPYHPDFLVAATADCVLWSRDRGAGWVTLRDDLTGVHALASARLA